MAHAAASACWCTCSVGPFSVRQHQLHNHYQEGFRSLCTSPAIFLSPPVKHRGQVKTSRRLDSVAVLPLLSLAAELPHFEVNTVYNDWKMDEMTLKNIYLCFSLFFVWGCCVYGSMKDPFYDSDVYRDAGGDGTGNWLYTLEEEEEVQAREELWREELAREIEERVGELKELEEVEKEKELV
eukprot:c25475_g1_i1 orf=313-858(-)